MEATMQEEFDKQKARKHTNPVLQELMSEITPEEMEKTRKEMQDVVWKSIWQEFVEDTPTMLFQKSSAVFLNWFKSKYHPPKPLKDE